jgi:hypothetical protein
LVLDELNIARVEYYLAEVLSRIENRRLEGGHYLTPPLAPNAIDTEATAWSKVALPENLCIAGSVNMDETTFGFSRKVLDRAFVIEFSDIELSAVQEIDPSVPPLTTWTSASWRPVAIQLSHHPRRSDARVGQVIENLTRINESLALGQLQVAYRVRDEIVMFCLAAEECADMFVTAQQGPVDPLDVAVAMKILPRIQGSGTTIRMVLEGLRDWASPPESHLAEGAQPGTSEKTEFPFCADRIDLMLRRLNESGFANYWL